MCNSANTSFFLIYVFITYICFLPDFAALTHRALPPAGDQPACAVGHLAAASQETLGSAFSHCQEARPSCAAAAVKRCNKTHTQSISLMDCAGNRPEGVCPIAACAQLRGWLFPMNHKPGQIAAWEINCLTSPISRWLLCKRGSWSFKESSCCLTH